MANFKIYNKEYWIRLYLQAANYRFAGIQLSPRPGIIDLQGFNFIPGREFRFAGPENSC